MTGVGIPSALLNSRMHVEGRAFDGQNVTTPADGGKTYFCFMSDDGNVIIL